MKLGILISVAIVAIIGLAVYFSTRGVPDKPTNYSSEKMLAKRDFSELPPLVPMNTGDASLAYTDLFNFYLQNQSTLDPVLEVPAETAEQLIDLLIKTHDAGTVNSAFLDDQIAMLPRATPKFGWAPQVIANVAMERAEELRKQDKQESKDRAEKAAKAAFGMGLTLFSKSNRVPIRHLGLEAMVIAGQRLDAWTPVDSELAPNLARWTKEVDSLRKDYWQPKHNVVNAGKLKVPEFRATIGDVLRYANEDKDISWRVEGLLTLGRIKFMPDRGKGNDTAITETIAAAKEDKDPQIAAAAKAAETFTKEDVRKMN